MSQQQGIQQYAKKNYQQTGSAHGVMEPDELVQAALQRWETIKPDVPLEQRSEFEPVFEALIGRVVTQAGQGSAFLTTSGGASR
jgi:hypothetical protein